MHKIVGAFSPQPKVLHLSVLTIVTPKLIIYDQNNPSSAQKQQKQTGKL